MRFVILCSAAALFGCAIAWVLSGSGTGRARLLRGLLIPVGVCGLWLLAVRLDSLRRGLTPNPALLFPDQLTKLLWVWLFLPIGLFVGAVIGVIRKGGMRTYFRCLSGSRPARISFAAVSLAGFAAVLTGAAIAGTHPASPLRISEICCGNFSLMVDPNTGDYEDYIELQNTGTEPIRLDGCFLSDRAKKRNLFRLPDITLEPGEYLLLWADGTKEPQQTDGEAISLNFSISPGETVYLTSADGILLDSVTAPERTKNISLSRREDAWVFIGGTPGRENGAGAEFVPPALSIPSSNYPSGFYDSPIEVRLQSDPGCTVHFTLDGSIPTQADPVFPEALTISDRSGEPNLVLSQPNTTRDRSGVVEEPVDKGTVLRAVATDETGASSEVFTAVYFIGAERFSALEGKAVLNITVDPDDLFGENGIAVTGAKYDEWLASGGEGSEPQLLYNQKGRDAERDARILLWDAERTPVLDTSCGIRLQGNSSRARAIKRFSLYARPIYGGDSVFAAAIFGEFPSHSFCTRPNVHDVMAQALTADLGLGGQASVPAVLFLNGELYSETYLRERYDKRYFKTHFGVEDDDLIVIADDRLDIGTDADYAAYRELMEYIQTEDCSDPSVYQMICEQIDVQNFAAYVASNLYLNNTDWSTKKNYRLWRTRSNPGGITDGRWRWLTFDMDACYWTRSVFGDAPRASYDIFHYPMPYLNKPFIELPMLHALLQNEEFRGLFVRTWLDLMNIQFSYESSLPILEELGLTQDAFWPEFLKERPNYAPELLIKALELPETVCSLELGTSHPEGGVVLLDDQKPELESGTWSGTWITGCPMRLTASPAPGWRFVGWNGAAISDAETIVFTPAGDTTLTACFEKLP